MCVPLAASDGSQDVRRRVFSLRRHQDRSFSIISHCGCIDQDRADLSSCRARPVLSTSRKLSSESVQLANLGRATPIKQRRRLTSAARPRSYCEPRSMQSRSGQARGGSERQYESSDKKKRSISATSGHSRWWRWAFMVGGANFHPGCGRSAPTCTPPPHAHACAQSCKFCAACWRSSQSDRISDDCYMPLRLVAAALLAAAAYALSTC